MSKRYTSCGGLSKATMVLLRDNDDILSDHRTVQQANEEFNNRVDCRNKAF